MARIQTISLDEYCQDILIREKNKSKYVREALKAYFAIDLLPSVNQILERLKNEPGFESKLIDFVKRMTAIIEGRH